ncbi:hypothetical protein GCM10022222_86070 [Amycolatopsis ultiminotia]|uniref:Helix-turn-helix DNA binding domain protein n=1 Tax=Amycolatopsis ultiminotia TaxID=543629 RepID=A0ABP6YSU7_9PSEU
MVALNDEIDRRVTENDIPLTERRSAAAKQVAELARRRVAIAADLHDVDEELARTLTASAKIMEIAELARFTDVSAADLSRWLDAGQPKPGRRKKPTSDRTRTKNAVYSASDAIVKPLPGNRGASAAPGPIGANSATAP